MSENLLIFLFTALGTWCFLLSGGMLGLIVSHVKMRVAVDLFVDSLGKGLAKALHADDDHLGMDAILDKYLAAHGDLSLKDWMELKRVCELAIANPTVPLSEKGFASMLRAVCDHKINKF